MVPAPPPAAVPAIMMSTSTTNAPAPAAPAAVPAKSSPGLLVKLACGAFAGITGTLIIYPIDMVKTRLQNQSTNQYRGMVDCFRTLVRTEGARGLYRGLAANLVGITPEKAIKLAVNDTVRARLAARLGVHEDKLPVAYGMLAGATAGMCQVVATCPMESAKINMQLAATRAVAGQPPKSLAQVVSELGVRGLYRGTAATLMRDVPFSIMFFPLHAWLKSQFAAPDGTVAFGSVFGSGLAAGWIAAGAVTPMDVIKTRLQAKAANAPAMSIRECFTTIVRNEGAGALFKGWLPRCMIVSPLFGITLLVYEAQQRYLSHIG
ncbi:hypothetical protein GGF31_002466 [Allomyces arbusculus]|nr:hypothetical protein GGF31_002466 [Allomyces arbusculus]